MGFWNGYQGGLYPNGSNVRPLSHNSDGLNFASQVEPLDTLGNPDPNGKIVLLSIGMSNASQESNAFKTIVDTFSQRNPTLIFVNGAKGGQTASIIKDSTAPYWDTVMTRLTNQGLSHLQVQAIWFKEADANPTGVFPEYAETLHAEFKEIMQILKNEFPNTNLCYHSSRIYGGYASTPLNPEPYAYHSGWTVKWTIEDQINGDTNLTYTKSPWLSWGPYLWADGLVLRSDSLIWVCPDDFQSDGTHPSLLGSQKVANLLLQFFSTDETTVPWFLSNPMGIHEDIHEVIREIKIIPNPFHIRTTVELPDIIEDGSIDFLLYNLLGREILKKTQIQNGSIILNKRELPAGIYFFQVKHENRIIGSGKLIAF